ncbi:hypothetical protein O0L34_g8053 [Tuta absoluta]|nr:hypothetical protein O0L34_g8053 [Tuta absoluta]
MDEIEFKLNSHNSVLVVNAVDKLISIIKSKFKLSERQKFVVENEELKYLREKCTSKESLVSLSACQGLLALVQLGVLEIGHTMSTVITLLPSAHNYSAIISTMAGLLTLDLKSRIIPGQPYVCQFSQRSPQHPFISVLEKTKGAEDDVINQMHALCTHPDYVISSNSLELLRPVFLWLTCECSRATVTIRPWQLLLSLPSSTAQRQLLLACISSQQICNPRLVERSFAAYLAVTDAAIYQQNREYVVALLPVLARLSNELIKHGRDPRACYNLLERCLSLEAAEVRAAASLAAALLAENLVITSAQHLHELCNLCLNILSKYKCSAISLNTLAALSLQWLHLPSYLTTSALKVASKILDLYQQNQEEDTRLNMPNLINNKTFQTLLYTDSHLTVTFKLHQIWERIRDDPEILNSWFDELKSINDEMKLELLPFLLGVTLEKRKDAWFEQVMIKVIDILIQLVNVKKGVSVQVLPVLLYKIANDKAPSVKMACLRALPLMATTKENVPTIVAILNNLKANKGVPTSFLIMLYTSLAETQVRCFPYLQEMLIDVGSGRPDDLKWETDIARAMAVKRICQIRASSHGLELVSVISSILNKCTDKAGSVATSLALEALVYLWRGAAVAPPSTWRALEPKLGRDNRPPVQISICKLLSEIPALRVSTPEYDKLVSDAARKLWSYVAESNHSEVVEAACDALAMYRIEDYQLKDVPEIYRRTVKLPPSFCKTPADAARRPEDVLDYIPCEIWAEVFKYTNQAALPGMQRLVTKLIEREIRGYRSGVYQPDARVEPRDMSYLPSTSVVRGLMECFRKQATTPSYDFTDQTLLAILETLTSEFPKPLPPVDLCFVHELYHRGALWKTGCVKLAARQANTSGSARRFVDNYLQGIAAESEETEIRLVFDLLPILCRGMPPNSLRTPLENCLGISYGEIVNIKLKPKEKQEKKGDKQEKEEYLFVRQMEGVKEALSCEKIHDANRTLLSQIVENYFAIISDDCVAWPVYVQACCLLSTKYLERMTSPSSWWEVEAQSLRKATAVRCSVAVQCAAPLVWLNEIIDAQATLILEQEESLLAMLPVLKAAKPDDETTRQWFLQLLARTQVAFNETEDESSKLYLFDVLSLVVIALSGQYSLLDRAGNRTLRRESFPSAAAALASRPAWSDCTAKLVEWLLHTRTSKCLDSARVTVQRALLALRHTDAAVKHGVWRLDFHFDKNTLDADD